MKKSAKPAPVTTAMVIYNEPFALLLDKELLDYKKELDKIEKVELSLAPHACEFSTSCHVNQKCNVVYIVQPTAHHSMKCINNPYITSTSYESPAKKTYSYMNPTVTVTKPTAVACPVIDEC
eukprot:13587440-Ditylum_brightwellii.AAC.1